MLGGVSCSKMTAVVRRKPYNRTRIISWSISLNKDGFAPCGTPNCPFMAFDCQEMVDHFNHCRAPMDESKLFMCQYCNKGTRKNYQLNNHIIHSHPTQAQEIGLNNFMIPIEDETKLTKVIKASWEVCMEHKGYIKCTTPFCHYLAENMADMNKHFGCCYKFYGNTDIYYCCDSCGGRTSSSLKMDQHIANCHPVGTNSTSPMNAVSLALIEVWVKTIATGEYIHCLTRDCKFISNEVDDMTRHFRFCRTPNKDKYAVCPYCISWLSPNKLDGHIYLKHADICVQQTDTNTLREKDEITEESITEMENRSKLGDLPLNFVPTKNLKQYKRTPKKRKCRPKFTVPKIPQSTRRIDAKSVKIDTCLKINFNITILENLNFDLSMDLSNFAQNFISLEVDLMPAEDLEDLEPLTEEPPTAMVPPASMEPSTAIEPSKDERNNAIKTTAIKNGTKRKRSTRRQYTNNAVNPSENVKSFNVSSCEFEKVKDPLETQLQQLGEEIVKENQSNLVPVKISVNDEEWTLNIPPLDVAQKVVQRERHSFHLRSVFKKSFLQSQSLLRLTSSIKSIRNTPFQELIGTSRRERIKNPSNNYLLQNILSLKNRPVRTAAQISKEPPPPQPINIDDPNEISQLFKKYSAEMRVEEENVQELLGLDDFVFNEGNTSSYTSNQESVQVLTVIETISQPL